MNAFTVFASDHVAEITATAGVVTYAVLRKKFTTGGVIAGVGASVVHMLHPWPAFFWLLMVFVACGIGVTKVGHARKAHLTLSSAGGGGGEGARTSVQVLANAGFASVLILLHASLLNSTPFISSQLPISPGLYAPTLQALLPIGIVAQYAAVAADTFSSELGILAKGDPFLITAPWRRVPRGTNGGVTIDGLLYGGLGSALLTLVAVLTLSLAKPRLAVDYGAAGLIAAMGLGGSIIDSLLGALVQATVVDRGSGKVVEGPGGTRVKVLPGGSRSSGVGWDLLTNNGVNFAMAALTSILTMAVAWAWNIELIHWK